MQKFTVYMLWIGDDGWDVDNGSWRKIIRESVLERGYLNPEERSSLLEAMVRIDTLEDAFTGDDIYEHITLLHRASEEYIRIERNIVDTDERP